MQADDTEISLHEYYHKTIISTIAYPNSSSSVHLAKWKCRMYTRLAVLQHIALQSFIVFKHSEKRLLQVMK